MAGLMAFSQISVVKTMGKKSILAMLFSVLLLGCATFQPLQRTQTASLAKGMTSDQANSSIGKATLLATYTFEAPSPSSAVEQYRARHYELQTATRQQLYTHCPSRRRACFPVIQNIPVTDSYVLVFRVTDDRLFAWGTVEELSRSPDDRVSAIMPALKAAYYDLQAKPGAK